MSNRWARQAIRPEVLTALACVAVIAAGLQGQDFAAQYHRVWLVRHHGLSLWDGSWYGGHQLLGYSVVFPALAALVGVGPLVATSCVASTACLSRLLGASRPARVATWWFSVSTVADLVIGRGPFALGLAAGLAAVLAARAGRRSTAAILAATCGLASPLTGALVLIFALAWCLDAGIHRALPLAAGVSGPAVALLGQEAGRFPFPWSSFLAVVAFVLLGLLLVPRHRAGARRTIALYGAVGCGCFLLPNPVGGNIARIATVLGAPLAAWLLLEARRPLALGVLFAPLLWWQLVPVASAVGGSHAASSERSYYAPLLGYLDLQPLTAGRIEVPFTRDHWEARYVATDRLIARGWDRQLDLAHNDLLYRALSARDYRSWLADNAVAYVALPDAPLDAGGRPEAALLRQPPPWLVPVFSSPHWRVWRVSGPTPIAAPPARVTEVGISSVVLDFARPGRSLVRVRWTPLWRTSAEADAGPAPGGWTYVESERAGKVVVATRLPLPWLRGATDPD